MIAVAKSGTAAFAPIFSNHLHIMNLDLQTAYAYMDTIQDTSNRWLIWTMAPSLYIILTGTFLTACVMMPVRF
jgi:hypothetical protein